MNSRRSVAFEAAALPIVLLVEMDEAFLIPRRRAALPANKRFLANTIRRVVLLCVCVCVCGWMAW